MSVAAAGDKLTLWFGTPNPKQRLVLQDKHRFIIFGGARGGGKSWVSRVLAVINCLKYPGIQVLIVRQSYPELKKNHINKLRKFLIGVAKYNDQDKLLRFENGSEIQFMYCQNDKDLDRLQGAEYDTIIIDEATMLTEYQIKAITATNRGVNDFPHQIILPCNPGGQGHGYIKRLIEGRFEGDEDPDDYIFIPSKVQDNLALMKRDPGYIKYLQALPSKIREAWLNGNWDVYLGQFFEEFRNDPEGYSTRRWTHVIEPFDNIPKHWTIYRTHDWGSNKPSATLWIAVDTDGVSYVLLELYTWTGEPDVGTRWTDAQLYTEIKKVEDTHPWLVGRHIIGVADPSIWGKGNGTGISTAEVAAQHGVHFTPADNQRIPGWMQVHYRLHFNEDGRPMLYINRNCQNLIRTFPLQMYDKNKPEDLDSDMEDHAVDALRYFCMARPIKAHEIVEKKDILFDPLDQYANIKPFRRV